MGPINCAFHKHANSKVQKATPSQLHFLLPAIIIMITSNKSCNTETHKTDRNPPITDHKPWPFEPVYVKFFFLRGPLRWLTAAKNANISWLLNFRVHVYLKSTVNSLARDSRHMIWCFWLQVCTCTLHNVSKLSFKQIYEFTSICKQDKQQDSLPSQASRVR